jgi:putative nucleotidyltransferase with HDIG domain
MNQIAILISRDQAIAGRTIRLVNSAFYGLRNRVSSIQQAIVVLGLNTVRNLTLGVSVVKVFEDNAQASSFDHEQFWLHSFATAQMSKHLAKELKRAEPEDYFLAGLLHDIGILVLDQYFHMEFLATFKTMLLTRKSMIEIEQLHFGMNHAATGAYIANRWQLPSYLGSVILAHHDATLLTSGKKNEQEILDVLIFANAYTHQKGIGQFIKESSISKERLPDENIGLSKTAIDACFSKTESEVRLLMKEWGL